MKVIPSAVLNSSELPLPNYRAKYVKNVRKKPYVESLWASNTSLSST